jgi:hypothetical protein
MSNLIRMYGSGGIDMIYDSVILYGFTQSNQVSTVVKLILTWLDRAK